MEGWLEIETLDVRELPHAIADFERAVAVDAALCARLDRTRHRGVRVVRVDARRQRSRRARCSTRAIAHGRQAVQLDDALAEAHGALALILVSAWDTPGAIRAARRAVALEPANWRHLFRLGHATWGDERLRAGAATLALYPDFAFAYFQSAMVHVARGHLTEAERVLRHGAAVQDRQIGRGERYPALGLHWLLGLVRLAQDDVEEALAEFDRERELARAASSLRPRIRDARARSAAAPRCCAAAPADAAVASFREALALYPDQPLAHGSDARVARSDGAEPAAASAPPSTRSMSRIAPNRRFGASLRGQLLAAQGDAERRGDVLDGVLGEAPRRVCRLVAPGRAVSCK